MPTPLTEQPVLHALGRIVATNPDQKTVTVQFAPLDANPAFVHNQQVQFKLDLGARGALTANDWVVASWNRTPKRDAHTGALQVQGNWGGGTQLAPVSRAATDPAHAHWFAQAAGQLQARAQTPGPVSGPDFRKKVDPFHEIPDAAAYSPAAIAPVLKALPAPPDPNVATEDAPAVWLPSPVGVPQQLAEVTYPDGYVRIGYVPFNLDAPTEEIRISQTATDHRIETLRSRSPVLKDNQHSQVQVSMSLTLTDNHAANSILLPLVRLFRRTPFLPVQNNLLQEAGVQALTLRQLSVSTMPGFPNGLRAELVASQFSWEPYMPAAATFDDQFCYPLLKLWAERPVPNLPTHTPLSAHWSGLFRMYHPDENWLKQVNEYSATAERGTRINHDVDLVRQAWDWQVNGPSEKGLEGFTNTTTPLAPFAPPGALSADALQRWELTEDIGRALYNGEEVYFLKLRSEEAVRHLIELDDTTVAIFQDGAQILAQLQNGVQVAGSLPGDQSVITPDTLRQALGDPVRDIGLPNNAAADPGSAGTRANLAAGTRFTFLVRAHDPVFRRLLTAGILTPPAAAPDPQSPAPDPDLKHAFAPTDMVVEQISCVLSNRIAELQLRGLTSASHQFMGSQAVEWQVAGTIAHNHAGRTADLPSATSHGADVAQIQAFFDRVQDLGRQYMGRADGTPFGGFVIVENELFAMMGVRHVMPLAWHFETIPNFPNALRFELTMIEFDVTQRRREIIQDMLGDLPAKATELTLLTLTDSLRGSYLQTQELNRRLRAIELYPDMALPTHAELADWVTAIQTDRVWNWAEGQPYPAFYWLDPVEGGTGWQWTTDEGTAAEAEVMLLPPEFVALEAPPAAPARFADPDFYCAPAGTFQHEFVEHVLRNTVDAQIKMTDPYGTESVHKVGERLALEHVTAGREVVDATQKGIDTDSHAKPRGASPRPIDQWKAGVTPTVQGAAPPPGGTGVKPAVTPPTVAPAVGAIPTDNSGQTSDRYHRYGPTAAYFANQYKIPQDLFFAQIERESQWNSAAVGPVTKSGQAVGLVQFEPGTWKEVATKLGFPNASPRDPVANLHAAAYFLRKQLNDFGGREDLALAAYNAGPGKVKKAKGQVPRIKETREYVDWIQAHRFTYQGGLAADQQAYQQDKEEIDRNAERLRLKFNAGYGYRVDDLRRYIFDARSPAQLSIAEQRERGDPGNGFQDVDARGGAGETTKAFGNYVWDHTIGLPGAALDKLIDSPKAAERNHVKDQIFDINWLYGIQAGWLIDTTADTERDEQGQQVAGGDGKWGTYFTVKAQFLPIFLKRMRDHHLSFEPVKIPHRLPGKYATQEAVTQNSKHYTDIREVFYAADGRDMFHDARESMTMGRLVGAFPTFYVALIDGGRWLRVWKVFDHVYGMMAVCNIAVHRTRKSPVETATVTFGNMFGHLTAAVYDLARETQNDTRGIWTLEALSRGLSNYLHPDEEMLAVWEQQRHTLMLKPGARLHIRLGYGADASLLPIVFNGVVSEVPVDEGVVSVVALSDGVELLNDLPPNGLQGATPVTTINGFMGEGANPAELIKSYLAPTATPDALSTLAGDYISDFFYYNFRNPYGIEHFGQGIRRGPVYDSSEIGVNIFNPESSVPYNTSSAWDNTLRILQVWRWDSTTKLIGVNLTDATPWAVFEVCRKTVPDYLCYVHPFGFRSTLFFGKGWFPIYYQYRTPHKGELIAYDDNLIPEAVMDSKPFQQFHVVHSSYNMLQNMVRADGSEVVTRVQAVGTYNGVLPGANDLSNEASYIMELDNYIYDEFQKLKVVQSGLYTTTNMKLTEANSDQGGWIRVALGTLGLLTGVGTGASLALLAAGPLKSFMRSRRVEDYAAAMTLKDHVKEMYQGQFLLFGNGYMKPYDVIAISDALSLMNGMAEVRDVTHTFSVDTGFVTAVSPDCIATFVDYEGRDLLLWLYYAASNFAAAFMLNQMVGKLARQVTPYILMQGVKNFRKWAETELRKARASGKSTIKELKMTTADLRATVDQLRTKERQLANLIKAKNGAQVLSALKTLTEEEPFKALFDQCPGWVKTQVITQKVLRGLPGSSSVTKAKEWAAGMGQKAENRYGQFTDKLKGARADAKTAYEQAQADLETAAGHDPKKIEAWKALEKKSRRWFRPAKELAELEKIASVEDREGVALVRALTKARKALWIAGAEAESAAVPTLLRGTLTRVMGEGLSAEAASFAGAAVFEAVIGSISDWLTRWAIARQCLTVFPLRIKDREFSAGINGHRGSVPGDRLIGLSAQLENLSGVLGRNPWIGVIPVLGDLLSSAAAHPAAPTQPYPNLLPPEP